MMRRGVLLSLNFRIFVQIGTVSKGNGPPITRQEYGQSSTDSVRGRGAFDISKNVSGAMTQERTSEQERRNIAWELVRRPKSGTDVGGTGGLKGIRSRESKISKWQLPKRKAILRRVGHQQEAKNGGNRVWLKFKNRCSLIRSGGQISIKNSSCLKLKRVDCGNH